MTAEARQRWLRRFPGRRWSVASLLAAGAGAAFLVSGLGVRGPVLHGVGWPLLVVLTALFAVVSARPDPIEDRRLAPVRLGHFAYFFGSWPLLNALLFGRDLGLIGTAVGSGVFALLMTVFFALLPLGTSRRRASGGTARFTRGDEPGR